ncbi:hypothetical protein [Gryllotalpicola koreensis]
MKGKLLFVTGLAVGYVLGSRAGRKRYDQIAAAANKVWQSPGIQKQVHAAQDYAAEKVGDIPGAVFDGVRKLTGAAIDRAQAKTTETQAKARAARAAAAESAAESASGSEPLDG